MLVFRINTDAKQKGMALVTILLIIAILTAILSRVSLSNAVWRGQVENSATFSQAQQSARAVQFWIVGVLEKDNDKFDAYTDTWAQTLPTLPIAWGGVDGWIEDMNARFNLNNLLNAEGKVDPVAMQNFERLLQALELNRGIAQSVVDWIDADDQVTGSWGAEDGYYLGMSPPYLAANRKFGEVAELRLVRGVSAEVWQKLEPHICALTQATTVNVNTATAPVLAAMMTNWGAPANALGKSDRWLKNTMLNPVTNMDSLVKTELKGDEGKLPAGLGIATNYFMAHIRLTFNQAEYRLATLYYRNKGRADIVWQAREFN